MARRSVIGRENTIWSASTTDKGFTWEKTDRVDALRSAAKVGNGVSKTAGKNGVSKKAKGGAKKKARSARKYARA